MISVLKADFYFNMIIDIVIIHASFHRQGQPYILYYVEWTITKVSVFQQNVTDQSKTANL